MNIKKMLKLLNEYGDGVYTVKMVNEYLTLFIDSRMITEGEIEVKDRLEVLIHERGLQYSNDDDDDSDFPFGDEWR